MNEVLATLSKVEGKYEVRAKGAIANIEPERFAFGMTGLVKAYISQRRKITPTNEEQTEARIIAAFNKYFEG